MKKIKESWKKKKVILEKKEKKLKKEKVGKNDKMQKNKMHCGLLL
jgi:hypothetical protein